MNPWLVPLEDDRWEIPDRDSGHSGNPSADGGKDIWQDRVPRMKKEFSNLLKRYSEGLLYLFDDPGLTESEMEKREGQYYKGLKKIETQITLTFNRPRKYSSQ